NAQVGLVRARRSTQRADSATNLGDEWPDVGHDLLGPFQEVGAVRVQGTEGSPDLLLGRRATEPFYGAPLLCGRGRRAFEAEEILDSCEYLGGGRFELGQGGMAGSLV